MLYFKSFHPGTVSNSCTINLHIAITHCLYNVTVYQHWSPSSKVSSFFVAGLSGLRRPPGGPEFEAVGQDFRQLSLGPGNGEYHGIGIGRGRAALGGNRFWFGPLGISRGHFEELHQLFFNFSLFRVIDSVWKTYLWLLISPFDSSSFSIYGRRLVRLEWTVWFFLFTLQILMPFLMACKVSFDNTPAYSCRQTTPTKIIFFNSKIAFFLALVLLRKPCSSFSPITIQFGWTRGNVTVIKLLGKLASVKNYLGCITRQPKIYCWLLEVPFKES